MQILWKLKRYKVLPTHTLKAYGWRGGVAAHINLKTRWMCVGAWSFCHFIYKERVPCTHCIRGWVSTRRSLHSLEDRKISCSWWDSDPRLSSPQPSLCTDYAAPGAVQVGAYVNGTNAVLPEGAALHRGIFEQDSIKYNNIKWDEMRTSTYAAILMVLYLII